MKIEVVVNIDFNTEIEMSISDDGYSLCPVCGNKAENKFFRPYDRSGYPSFAICDCGIEYGVDCEPDSTKEDWKTYRARWFKGELTFGNSLKMSMNDKLKQLQNINVTKYDISN